MKFQTAVLVVVALFAVQMIGECNASRFNMKAGSEKGSGVKLEQKSKVKCFGNCTMDSECQDGKCTDTQIDIGGQMTPVGGRCIGCAELPCNDSSRHCCKGYACAGGQCYRSKDTKKCGIPCRENIDCPDGECSRCVADYCHQ
eukprot:196368_1